MEEDVAHLKAAIEQLVVDPAARQQALDLLSRIERSSQRAAFSADRTRKEMEVQFRLLSRTTDDLRKALGETEERVRERTRQLEAARDQLAELNRTLKARVAEQVAIPARRSRADPELIFAGGGPNDTRIGFTATARIHRHEFAVSWNADLQDAGVVVGDDVFISLDVQAELVEEKSG